MAFRRGIGVSHVMEWAAIEPGPAREFVFPPFSNVGDAQFSAELQAIRRTGFDFVRFAVDPGPFLQFHAARRDVLDRLLIARVKLILAAGLAVVVDFHPSDMNPDYTAQALTAGAAVPVFQAYLRLLERTAALLEALHSDRVGLELMNEPPVQQSTWQPMLDAAYAAARAHSAHLILVLEGGNEASAAALLATRIAAFASDPAVLYSFHYYDPYQFTHQGASWNPARYLADVPYPARARPLDDSLAATVAAIDTTDLSEPRKSLAYQDAQARLEEYHASAFDGGTIAQAFARIARWAQSHGIATSRVILGEFGARQTALQLAGARARERAQWFHDVSHAAEANGFGWSVWAYRGGGFALAQSAASNEIDPGIAEALGLDFRARKVDASPGTPASASMR
ncbi:MAG: cellulase family glycosylhydrolase [Xanthobacteraceae bacterium]